MYVQVAAASPLRMIEIENQSGSRADRLRGGQNKSGGDGDNNGVDDADAITATRLKEIGEKSSYKRSLSRSYRIIIILCTRKGRKGGIGREMV